MITQEEINRRHRAITPEIQANLDILVKRINALESACPIPMLVTSGLRSAEDQMRINPKAPNSMHTKGAAVDILDADGELKKWVLKNVSVLESIGLWCEDFSATATWVHFQILAPRSGHRFFLP